MTRTNNKTLVFSACFLMGSLLSGCLGTYNEQTPNTTISLQNNSTDLNSVIVKARAEIPILLGTNKNERIQNPKNPFQLLGNQAIPFPISLIISPSTEFDVNPENFFIPGEPYEGMLDFGFLNVDRLRDNYLRDCGSPGAKCTKAGIRVYTKDTPGAGLWNGIEGYGLPILSSGNLVGLGENNAAVVSLVNIGNTLHIIKLCHFTQTSCVQSNAQFPVPISIDFSDASAGTYSTTLVIEYFLQ
jgi:hypothetical protein